MVQESLEEATVLLKETREENAALKEMAANQTASSPADSGHVEVGRSGWAAMKPWV